jgi:hypothetical protein
MTRSLWSLVAVLAPMAATSSPASAALKVTPGQEFLYSGRLQFKQSVNGGPMVTTSGSVKLSALVTEADSARGYTVVLMRQFQPDQQADQRAPLEDVWLATVRYRADLTASGMPSGTPDPIRGPVLDAVQVPFPPRAELKPGEQWHQAVALPYMARQPLDTVSTVEGFGKVVDHPCLQIENRLSQPLPVQQHLTDSTQEVTDYGETLCVDADTGEVRSVELHESVTARAKTLQLTNTVTLQVTLQGTRQIPAAELVRRARQAETLDRVQQALLGDASGTDHLKTIEAARRDLSAFQKEYPDSPYAPVVARLDHAISDARAQAERGTQFQALTGRPAPAFTLRDLAGKEQTLAAYRGKLILLNFFASW